jgi:glyoxylase-like metal-dependent hydrolase (beta-lactamase superfamily II)
MSLDFDVFMVDPKPIPSAVPGFEQAAGPATWPPSTSTLIWADDEALLVDCLITTEEGRNLAAWVASHGCELAYVYITHRRGETCQGCAPLIRASGRRPVPVAQRRRGRRGGPGSR